MGVAGQQLAPRQMLIAGVSGVVGFAAAHHFSSQGWQVLGLSRRRPNRLPNGVEHLTVDLAEPQSLAAIGSQLTGVTHLVYAALYEKPGLMPGWVERDQMERNLAMLANLHEPLSEVADLKHISLLQGTKAYGAHVEPMVVPGRERNPRHQHENFYWLQEDYLRDRQSANSYAWTILRPQVIYGEAQGGNMNALPALGVYASLLRADGRPLDFPGGMAPVSEAVDADLLARMLEWVATNPAAANQTFNVTNGDVYSLRNVWPVLADSFGMDVGDAVPMSLKGEIPAREPDWAKLVDQFDLEAPTSLEAFVGQSFIYADMLLGHGQTSARPPSLVSTIKARQAGFTDCVDTEDMFARLIANLQEARLLPPRRW
jgi:nucleoside-diphosphate-sugar epimerase